MTYGGVKALMKSIIGLFKSECIATTGFPDGPVQDRCRRGIRHRRVGSIGTSTAACTARWRCSPRWSTSRTTTLLSTRSRNPPAAAGKRLSLSVTVVSRTNT